MATVNVATSQNLTAVTYAQAWANKTTLTYNQYQVVGV